MFRVLPSQWWFHSASTTKGYSSYKSINAKIPLKIKYSTRAPPSENRFSFFLSFLLFSFSASSTRLLNFVSKNDVHRWNFSRVTCYDTYGNFTARYDRVFFILSHILRSYVPSSWPRRFTNDITNWLVSCVCMCVCVRAYKQLLTGGKEITES